MYRLWKSNLWIQITSVLIWCLSQRFAKVAILSKVVAEHLVEVLSLTRPAKRLWGRCWTHNVLNWKRIVRTNQRQRQTDGRVVVVILRSTSSCRKTSRHFSTKFHMLVDQFIPKHPVPEAGLFSPGSETKARKHVNWWLTWTSWTSPIKRPTES